MRRAIIANVGQRVVFRPVPNRPVEAAGMVIRVLGRRGTLEVKADVPYRAGTWFIGTQDVIRFDGK